ncbi:molybdopterin-dependent oxidoreductase [Mycobacterium colombiense]|uniref:Oxidoreductase n=1 Tax=Mycobacterium colombiense CECT 3035 TaxID=1041522 RepID=J4JVQ6_9MYCO|nr:molybdopterin-dependent oxidoreductase [Mycobacterium colombiense]EJO89452.1 oxidoreductase [Mycobacterium colombiense CECT 3035]
MAKVYTSCRICGQRCGLTVTVEENRVAHIGPDKQNPLSWKDFCVKGRTAGELVQHPRRVVTPMRRVGDRYVAATYEDAFDEIADALRGVIERGGPDALGCYFGNPMGYDPAAMTALRRFMASAGSHSIFNWGSVDTNAKAVVNGEMFGVTMLPLIPDVDACDCFLFVGTNPADSKLLWITSVPNGWNRVLDRVKHGADLIVLDPYRTATASAATAHWATVPGEDWAFLLGMLKIIFDRGLEDRSACAAESGVDDLRRLLVGIDVEALAQRAGVPPNAIEKTAVRFGSARSAIALARTGVSQTRRGTLALWLTEVLNVVTGNWDRPGGRYFQPGFTPPRLPAYEPAPHVSRIARRPAIEGCHSVAELPGEILTPGHGRIRALVMAYGNPVITGPEGNALDEALADLELFIAIDMVQRESHRHAHWLIPGTHWLERDEFAPFASITQEVPFAQFTPKAVDPPLTVRPESAFFDGLGRAMGLPGFGADDPPYSLQTACRRALERGGQITWEEVITHPHGVVLGGKTFGHARNMLRTPDGRIQLAPKPFVAELERQLRSPRPAPPPDLPLQVGNRRRRSSMNSFLNDLPGARRLLDHNRVELNEHDAAHAGIRSGDLVRVRSATGSIDLIADVTDAPRRGVVVIEHGWGSRVFDPTGSEPPDVLGANRNLLTARTEEDPLSQMSAFNETWVAVEPAPKVNTANS